ncbi:hypothetical protein [Pseudomonas chlororaphis]|jgi:hypothetical protein|uniref:hypothetical protein n=1 Tax=Pseudomonas chlororaphis TaxID=587753 RepID=UPI001C60B5E1|nr:hypothetical protein [Pseudomonas chlororaphis]
MPPAARAAFEVHTLAYERTETPFVSATATLAEAALALGLRTGKQAQRYASEAGPIDDYVLSSTVLSQFLADGSSQTQNFQSAIAATCGRRPDWLTNAYECTGWGFILRHVQQKARLSGPRRLLLQIVDTDIHNFTYWLGTHRWGKSGFGICTLVIDVAASDENTPALGASSPEQGLLALGRGLRNMIQSRPGMSVAVPFFPQMSRRALLKCFNSASVHTDHYPRFGHSFGSDPWLSLLAELTAGTAQADSDCLVSSLALNGYFAIAQVTLARALRFSLEGEV